MKTPRVFPLLFMAGLIGMQILFDAIFPGGRVIGSPMTWLGAISLGLGGALIAVAAGLFRRRHTTLNPHAQPVALVTDGLYRHSRNPMYLGMLLVLAGAALWLGHLAAFAVLPVFVAVVTSQNIRREEQQLEARFGEAYRDYRRRVRRWI